MLGFFKLQQNIQEPKPQHQLITNLLKSQSTEDLHTESLRDKYIINSFTNLPKPAIKDEIIFSNLPRPIIKDDEEIPQALQDENDRITKIALSSPQRKDATPPRPSL